MSQPYLGEIRIFAGNFAPVNWHFCDGSLIAIGDNSALFALIGTTYGGDGQNTFALPDLRSRIPVHQGNSFVIGQRAGAENVALITSQLPLHSHTQVADSNAATSSQPDNNFPAAGPAWYTNNPPSQILALGALAPAGGNQPHPNLVPYVAVNYIICLAGSFPRGIEAPKST